MVVVRKSKTKHEIERHDNPYCNAQIKSTVAEGGIDSVLNSDPQLLKWKEMQEQLNSLLTVINKLAKVKYSNTGSGNSNNGNT